MEKIITLTEMQLIYEKIGIPKGMIGTIFELNKKNMVNGLDYIQKGGNNRYGLTLSGYAIMLTSLPHDIQIIREISNILVKEKNEEIDKIYKTALIKLEKLGKEAGVSVLNRKTEFGKLKFDSFNHKPFSNNVAKSMSCFRDEYIKEHSLSDKNIKRLENRYKKNKKKKGRQTEFSSDIEREGMEWFYKNIDEIKAVYKEINPEINGRDASLSSFSAHRQILGKMKRVYGFVIEDTRSECAKNNNLDAWPKVEVGIYDNQTWKEIYESLLCDKISCVKEGKEFE